MRWLLCDYGQVLSLPPSDEDRRALEAIADIDPAALWTGYWAHRLDYDCGALDTGRYWTEILGQSPEPDWLDRLLETDVAMWSRPNKRMLQATAAVAERGAELAVLSNAPVDFGDRLDKLGWLAPFSPRLFSGHLGLMKPDPAIYRFALDQLRARPEDVTFVDDRPENVDGARVAGMRSILFTDAVQTSRLLDGGA